MSNQKLRDLIKIAKDATEEALDEASDAEVQVEEPESYKVYNLLDDALRDLEEAHRNVV